MGLGRLYLADLGVSQLRHGVRHGRGTGRHRLRALLFRQANFEKRDTRLVVLQLTGQRHQHFLRIARLARDALDHDAAAGADMLRHEVFSGLNRRRIDMFVTAARAGAEITGGLCAVDVRAGKRTALSAARRRHELSQQLGRGLRPVGGRCLHHPRDHVGELGGVQAVQVVQRAVYRIVSARQRGEPVGGGRGRLADDAVKQRRAQAVDVGPGSLIVAPAVLLYRGVARRQHDGQALVEHVLQRLARRAEIEQHRRPRLAHQYVARLDVAVQVVLGVQRTQAAQHVHRHRAGLLLIQAQQPAQQM